MVRFASSGSRGGENCITNFTVPTDTASNLHKLFQHAVATTMMMMINYCKSKQYATSTDILLHYLFVIGFLVKTCHGQNCNNNNNRFRSIFSTRTIDPESTNQQYPFPNIDVNGKIFSSDAPHLVSTVSSSLSSSSTTENSNDGILRVMLPGTTDSPNGVSCLLDSLLIASPQSSSHVIGLSYQFLNSPDSARNQACSTDSTTTTTTTSTTTQCLANQHEDTLWGGNSEPEIWPEILYHNSIVGRLTLLIKYLSNQYPKEGWDMFLSSSSSNGEEQQQLNWDRIWILGHSQGAGHAAYLAHKVQLAGAGFLSGPQDENLNDSDQAFWVDLPFATSNIRAMAHHDENAIDTIQKNWFRMEPFVQDNFYLIEDEFDATKIILPTDEPWITTIKPQPNAPCTRSNHCSTALNDNSPLLDDSIMEETITNNPYLYAISIWPQVAGIDLDFANEQNNNNNINFDSSDGAATTTTKFGEWKYRALIISSSVVICLANLI